MKKFYFVYILVFIIMIFICLKPFSLYFEQKYQISLPNSIKNSFFLKSSEFLVDFFKKPAANNIIANKNISFEKTEISKTNILSCNPKKEINEKKIFLARNVKFDEYILRNMRKRNNLIPYEPTVLLMGDSLMKDISLFLSKELKKDKFNVINLTKPSTGLNNKDYFNATSTLSKIISKHKISILIILYGTNDAWSTYKNNTKISFGTDAWNNFYSNRVKEILNIAKNNNIAVFWLELPCMQSKSFDRRMKIINQIDKLEVESHGYNFLSTRKYICKNDEFAKFYKIGNKTSRIRKDDGIHLSIHGSIFISDFILNALRNSRILKNQNSH